MGDVAVYCAYTQQSKHREYLGRWKMMCTLLQSTLGSFLKKINHQSRVWAKLLESLGFDPRDCMFCSPASSPSNPDSLRPLYQSSIVLRMSRLLP
ncbi:hypothetical protein XELAEV_18043952mg [Xenopus laevis]|uniref:Uncharacterized protein n=1 Tax=Xenopus laevis TaxID=8355 RepID=A0A974BXW1_XENLA|nr:hypothetical protein XELAEV_18043952mg [Xenopus laevis]